MRLPHLDNLRTLLVAWIIGGHALLGYLVAVAILGPTGLFVIRPASVWLAYTAAHRQVSFCWVISHRDPLLDSGAPWFALVLLLYSVAFALWRRLMGDPRRPRHRPLTGLHLAGAVVIFLHGDRDQLVPVTAARSTARVHPAWNYGELPGVGHLPQLRCPTSWPHTSSPGSVDCRSRPPRGHRRTREPRPTGAEGRPTRARHRAPWG